MCVGDSITEGHGVAAAAAYPALLQGLLGDKVKVVNLGLGGRTVNVAGDRPYQKEEYYEKAKTYGKGDTAVFMLGTNDAKVAHWSEMADYEAGFKTCYKQIVTQLMTTYGRVFVMLPPPCSDIIDDHFCHAVANVTLQKLIRELTAECGLPAANLINLFEELGGAGLLRQELFMDSVHPNEEGHDVIADEVYDVLKKHL